MKAMCWAALVMMVSLSLVSQAAQPGVKMATEVAHWASGLKTHGKAPASPSGQKRRLLPMSCDEDCLSCMQMYQSISGVADFIAADLLMF